ncbi:hypothetical protein [Lujinxingia sediminis]|uniref:hypothetical protein n=1 Tax=Lujinxingia sediminis TaxID=2480984 RepID=UPI0013E3DFB5|nr:hypothetical protein [Lujinxingia sediminis]
MAREEKVVRGELEDLVGIRHSTIATLKEPVVTLLRISEEWEGKVGEEPPEVMVVGAQVEARMGYIVMSRRWLWEMMSPSSLEEAVRGDTLQEIRVKPVARWRASAATSDAFLSV